jgi:hypothetical protein
MIAFIKEQWVHDAFDYLRDESDAAAAARGNLARAEFYRKKRRAELILTSDQRTQDLRIAYAECHPDYEELCLKAAAAEEEVEKHKNSRSRAEAIIDAWRTEQATMRGLGRVA